MTLRLRNRSYWYGDRIEVTEDEPRTLASVGYGIVAMTLAEPLRKAFREHLGEHGCEEPYGFAYCPDAVRLWDMLPAGDRIVIA
jgi:hypothetical protein